MEPSFKPQLLFAFPWPTTQSLNLTGNTFDRKQPGRGIVIAKMRMTKVFKAKN